MPAPSTWMTRASSTPSCATPTWFTFSIRKANRPARSSWPGASEQGPITDLQVHGSDIVIKRKDPVELFQVYDRASGAFRRAVHADVEQLSVRFPNVLWTAGEQVPLAIDLNAGPQTTSPHWRVWLRPFNTPEFQELPLANGTIAVPPTAGGLYQVRICPGLAGAASEYEVETLVEVRAANAKGSISLLTPLNRLYFGQGEEIPVCVICRAASADALPSSIAVVLTDGQRTIAEQTVPCALDTPSRFTLGKAFTAALAPGSYRLTAQASGFTVAGQSLVIGPGLQTAPVFSLVQHGDYSAGFPRGGLLDTPEIVAGHLTRAGKLGFNMFVDRLGHGGGGVLGNITQAIDNRCVDEPAEG